MENEQKHIYEYDVDMSVASAPATVVQLVGSGKRVLEVGCGPGSITKMLATAGQCTVTGMELDPTAIAKAAPFCERVLQADLNAPDWPRLLGDRTRFDVVVAADVLEHLYDPWRALQQMVPLLDAEGYIVISLPHAGHAAVVACLLDGDFEYRNSGLLDRTHIRFFGLKNIEALFAQAQLKIIEVRYVVIVPEETDLAPHWAALSDTARAALRSSPYANIYQVVLKAVPLEREGATISLIPELAPQPVPKPAPVPEPAPSLKSRVGAYLSPAAKVMIRKGFGSIGIKL